MPTAPYRPCSHPGCDELVAGGRCDDHQRARARDYNRRRPKSDDFYDSAQWRRFRRAYLSRNPLCVICLKAGRTTPAVDVDHITPRSKGGADFAEDNLQAVCKACHSRKTVRDNPSWHRNWRCA